MARLNNSKLQLLDKICLLLAVLTVSIPFAAHAQTKAPSFSNSASSASAQPNSTHNALISPMFLPPVFYGTGGFFPFLVTVADVNGDGKPDVIVANDLLSQVCNQTICRESGVGVLIGNGDGTFQPPVSYDSGGFANTSVAVADVNGDGKADLVVTNNSPSGAGLDGVIGVLFGNGDGTFQPPVLYDSGGCGAWSVKVGDVNGDGKPDLVVANWCTYSGPDGTLGVLLGNGDGTFQPAAVYDSGAQPAVFVAIADVNGDGKPDLLVANWNWSGPIGVLLGKGDGTFQPVVTYSVDGVEPWSIAIADVNADGKADIVVGSSGWESTVAVLLGNGDGTFRAAAFYNSGVNEPQAVAVADVNGDGKPDLIVGGVCNTGSCNIQSAVSVLAGNGDGTFQPAVTFVVGDPYSFTVQSLAAADLNGDGKPDIVAALSGGDNTGPVSVLLNKTPFCTTPPTVTISVTPRSLWPPNGRMVPVRVSGKITDSDNACSIKAAVFTVKDEYGKVQPSGALTLGPGGVYSFTAWLQASRLGSDLDGRQYTVTVGASNNVGKTGSQSVMLTVPRDLGH